MRNSGGVLLAALVAAGGCEPRPLAFADAAAPADAGADKAQPAARRVALAAALGADVVYVSDDGSSRVVYHFDTATFDPSPSAGFNVTHHGEWVVASASWWGSAACALEGGLLTCDETDSLVLLDLDGRVHWQKTWPARTSSAARGVRALPGDGGQVVLVGPFGALLVAPDGAETRMGQVMPLARPFAGPAVPVRLPPDESGHTFFAWWSPRAPVPVTPSALAVAAPLDAFDDGNQLAFVAARVDGTRVIVHARPEQTEALPEVDLGASAPVAAAGSWRLVYEGGAVSCFDLLTGQSVRRALELPPGLRSLGFGLASDGALVEALRDDASAGVYLSPLAASGWTRVGKTLAQVEDVQIQDVGGTLLVDAHGTDDFFVPHQTWPAGADADLLQTSHQLVRPADGIAVAIAPDWYGVELTRDGRRAAYWEGTRLVLLDVVSGARTLTLQTHAATPPSITWID